MVTGRQKAACRWRVPAGGNLRKEAGYMLVSGVESLSVEGIDGLLVNGRGNDG